MTVPPEGSKRPVKQDVGEYRDDKTTDYPLRGPNRAVLGLSACTNPYDPIQGTIGGGFIGAGSGAAIGAAAADGRGAALGAAVGGAVGAVAGLITTPPPPAYHVHYNQRGLFAAAAKLNC